MIKPATLWAAFKTCPNDAWIGRICRALGGQKVSLDFGQQQMVDIITTDSDWMDERVEAKREAWRKTKKQLRTSGRKENTPPPPPPEDIEDIEDMSSNGEDIEVSDTIPPSIPPSTPPSVPPSVPPSEGTDVPSNEGSLSGAHASACAGTCAREGDAPESPEEDLLRRPQIPPREEQLAAARNLGIPESYVDVFLADLKRSGYQYVNRGASLVTLNRNNFSALLGMFYKQHQDHPENGRGKGRHKVKHPDNWVDMDEQARKEFVDGMQ